MGAGDGSGEGGAGSGEGDLITYEPARGWDAPVRIEGSVKYSHQTWFVNSQPATYLSLCDQPTGERSSTLAPLAPDFMLERPNNPTLCPLPRNFPTETDVQSSALRGSDLRASYHLHTFQTTSSLSSSRPSWLRSMEVCREPFQVFERLGDDSLQLSEVQNYVV